MADRYLYFPSVGGVILLVWGCGEWARGRGISRGCLAGAGAVAIVACGCLTIRQSSYWRDSATLFAHTLAVTRNNELAHERLAEALLAQHKVPEARAHLLAALEIAPRFAEAHHGLGLVAQAEGHLDQTIAQWQTALQLKAGWFALMNNLAWLLATTPDPANRNGPEALRLAEHACASDARNPSYFDTLGAAYAEAGQFAEAAAAAQTAMALAQHFGLTNAAARFRSRLELYQSGNPYRQPP